MKGEGRTAMTTAEDNKRLTLNFFDAMQRGDAEAIADTYADEGRVVTMGNTLISGSRGKDEIRRFAGGVLDAFPSGLKFTILNMTAEENDWAVAFSVPADWEGVTLINAAYAPTARKKLQAPFNEIGMSHSITVFDNCFVPWERVFLAGETDIAGKLALLFALYHRHSYTGCKPAMTDVITGATALMAEVNGIEKAPHVREKLAELICTSELCYAAGIAAAINGMAIGAGFTMPLAGADLIYMSEHAWIEFPFVGRLGILPEFALTYFLPRMMGFQKAKEIIYFPKRIPAQQALEWGCVNEVVPHEELIPRAQEIARKLIPPEGPGLAVKLAKRAFHQPYVDAVTKALGVENQGLNQTMKSHDFGEGLKARKEKRSPVFKGE